MKTWRENNQGLITDHFKVGGDQFKETGNHFKVDGDHFKVDGKHFQMGGVQWSPPGRDHWAPDTGNFRTVSVTSENRYSVLWLRTYHAIYEPLIYHY